MKMSYLETVIKLSLDTIGYDKWEDIQEYYIKRGYDKKAVKRIIKNFLEEKRDK